MTGSIGAREVDQQVVSPRIRHSGHAQSAALQEGVIMVPDGRMYVSAAHTQTDIELTLERFDAAFRVLR